MRDDPRRHRRRRRSSTARRLLDRVAPSRREADESSGRADRRLALATEARCPRRRASWARRRPRRAAPLRHPTATSAAPRATQRHRRARRHDAPARRPKHDAVRDGRPDRTCAAPAEQVADAPSQPSGVTVRRPRGSRAEICDAAHARQTSQRTPYRAGRLSCVPGARAAGRSISLRVAAHARRLAGRSRFSRSSARGSVSGTQAAARGSAPRRRRRAGRRRSCRPAYAERDRLAVHRPAGRDDEVGERDQALRVDRPLGDDHRRQRERAHVLALLVGPRQDERVHALVACRGGRARQREERVRRAGGRARRRAAVRSDDEHALRVELERGRARAGSGSKSAR